MAVYTFVVSYNGQTGRNAIQNRYDYFSDNASLDSEQLASDWYQANWPTQRIFTSNLYAISSVSCVLAGSIDSPSVVTPDPASSGYSGAVGGDVLPQFAAFAFRLDRSTTLTRNGQKRLPGVPETSQNNGLLSAPVLSQMGTWATLVRIFNAENATLAMVICRRNPAGAIIAQNPVRAVSAIQQVSTQNSRKPGR